MYVSIRDTGRRMNGGAHTKLIRRANQGCIAKNGEIITDFAESCRTFCNTAPRALKGKKLYAKSHSKPLKMN